MSILPFTGQGYDGAHVMAGRLGGVQKLIADQVPRAIYVHCSNHSLDLVLRNSCDHLSIKSFFGTVKSIIKFFRKSPKRRNMFKAAVNATSDSNSRRCNTLIKMCETRLDLRKIDSKCCSMLFVHLQLGGKAFSHSRVQRVIRHYSTRT